jgi:hypothetical protein
MKPLNGLTRAALAALALFATLTACQKHDEASQPSNGQVAREQANKLGDAALQAAQQAAKAVDQAASFVGQQAEAARQAAQGHVDSLASGASAPSITLSTSGVSAAAQAHVQSAASAANAALGQAASAAGYSLETAGRRLQSWASQNAASSAAAGSAVTGDTGKPRGD